MQNVKPVVKTTHMDAAMQDKAIEIAIDALANNNNEQVGSGSQARNSWGPWSSLEPPVGLHLQEIANSIKQSFEAFCPGV